MKKILASIVILIVMLVAIFLCANIRVYALTNEESNNEELIEGVYEVNDYDKKIKQLYKGTIDKQIKSLVLKRTFVDRFGYENLQKFASENETNKEALTYILENEEILNYLVTGGTIDKGNYTNVLNAWSSLYTNFKEDWVNYKEDKTDLMYLKMAISLSLVNSGDITFWSGSKECPSVPTERYFIFKKLIEENNFNFVSNWSTEKFADLPIELMRLVVNNMIHDDELIWLSDIVKNKASETNNNPEKYLDAYYYMSYTKDFNYDKNIYYDKNKYNEWNKKYSLQKISFTSEIEKNKEKLFKYGSKGYHRLWMVFQEGGICGAVAKTYANLSQTFGIPSTVIGQPGHEATLRLSIDENGIGTWRILNDISRMGTI